MDQLGRAILQAEDGEVLRDVADALHHRLLQLLSSGRGRTLEGVAHDLEVGFQPALELVVPRDQHDVGRPLVQPRADRVLPLGFQQPFQLLHVGQEDFQVPLRGPEGGVPALGGLQVGPAGLVDLLDLLEDQVALLVVGIESLAGHDSLGRLLLFAPARLGARGGRLLDRRDLLGTEAHPPQLILYRRRHLESHALLGGLADDLAAVHVLVGHAVDVAHRQRLLRGRRAGRPQRGQHQSGQKKPIGHAHRMPQPHEVSLLDNCRGPAGCQAGHCKPPVARAK